MIKYNGQSDRVEEEYWMINFGKINKQIGFLFVAVLLLVVLIPSIRAIDYSEPIPLPQLGSDTYLGMQGGLYSNGANNPPTSYVIDQIQPAYNILENDTHIVVLCLGMSNLTHTCDALINKMAIDMSINSAVKMVNGGQPGRAQQAWDGDISTTDGVWANANKRLTQAGETPETVDIIIYFNAWAYPNEPDFEAYVQTMHDSLTITMDNISTLYANTQLIYIDSREYAGYTVTDLNPDPWAYWDGFAFKRLVEDRINNVQSEPPLLWAAYQYDPTWPNSYFKENDGTHLSDAGLDAASQLWLNFFKTEPWFGSDTDPIGTSTPPSTTPTSPPTSTMTPFPTPTSTRNPIIDEYNFLPFVIRAP